MNTEKIIKYIYNPENLDQESTKLFHDLIEQYPYFQTAHLLYLKSLKKNKHIGFESQLKKSSVFITDRKKLYNFLNQKQQNEAKAEEEKSRKIEEEKKKAEEEVRIKAENEAKAEEEKSRKIEEEKKKAEEEARIKAKNEAKAEEEKSRKIEEEKKKAEEEARIKAENEAKAEEEKSRKIEEEKKKAEEEARIKAENEAKAEEEKLRKIEEEKKKAEEEARIKAENEAKAEEEKLRKIEEEKKKAEEEARIKAENEAKAEEKRLRMIEEEKKRTDKPETLADKVLKNVNEIQQNRSSQKKNIADLILSKYRKEQYQDTAEQKDKERKAEEERSRKIEEENKKAEEEARIKAENEAKAEEERLRKIEKEKRIIPEIPDKISLTIKTDEDTEKTEPAHLSELNEIIMSGADYFELLDSNETEDSIFKLKEDITELQIEELEEKKKLTFTEWLAYTSGEKKKQDTIRNKSEAYGYNQPEDTDENPDISKSSVEESDELITETLADIYIKQKYFDKAISAFEKLSLKYPEKSIYFAGRIKNTKELIKHKKD